jgi:hypothetical protein
MARAQGGPMTTAKVKQQPKVKGKCNALKRDGVAEKLVEITQRIS